MRSFLFILMYVIGGQFHSFAQDKTSDGNFFKSAYHQQVTEGKSISAESSNYGYFKSNSGWKDGKYYLLINEVLPGTIVKLNCSQHKGPSTPKYWDP